MLFLISTPIGNLQDFSQRAISTLTNCDYALCEDTRTSKILLERYQIQLPLVSYHKFNEAKRIDGVLKDLKNEKSIALLSDAGTPLIADPGFKLVSACVEHKVEFTTIPGPCACLSALLLSGFDPSSFTFMGFLAKKPGEQKQALLNGLFSPHTTLYYLPPSSLSSCLKLLQTLAPTHPIALVKEISKKHETILRGSAEELYNKLPSINQKGEWVLILSPGNPDAPFLALSPKEHIEHLKEHYQLSEKDAIWLAARMRKVPKQVLYKAQQKNTEFS